MTGKMQDTSTTLAELKEFVGTFIDERQWGGYHSPKNVAVSIVLEASELLEHFQWWHPQPDDLSTEQHREIGEEMADVLAYLLSLARVLNIDLAAALQAKMAKNRLKYPPDQFQGTWTKVES